MVPPLAEERRRRTRALDTLAAIVLTLGAIAFIANLFVGRTGFDFAYMQEKYPIFLEATKLTLYATTLSFVIGMAIGFFVGWARTARIVPLRKTLYEHARFRAADTPRWKSRLGAVPLILSSTGKYYLRRVADAYVEIIRGTPLFVQIVFAWSVLLVNYPRLADLGLIAGIAALTANTGGYQSEIFRAGLQTVHAGQAEAARAVGMSRLRAMRYVVLPQALRLIIPPLTNEYIGLLKASSFLFVIGVQELTTVGKSEAFREFKVFEVFALVTGIYFLMTVPLSKAIAYVERRYRIPGLGMQQARTARV